MKSYTKLFYLLASAALLLGGCRPASQPAVTTVEVKPAATQPAVSPTQTAPVEAASQDATPYPAPTQYSSPTPVSYPNPQATLPGYIPPPFVVPTPSEGNGVVVGQMIDANTGEPMAYVYVYLGKKILLTPGPGYTYGLQEKSSPHIQTNDQGQFAISDVEPGSYLVMIFTPRSVSVVMQPNSDKELEVNVAAGDTLELGELQAVPPVY